MSSQLNLIKKNIRSEMKSRLSLISPETLKGESLQCCRIFLDSNMYRSSNALSVYLSMPNELQTSLIISTALIDKKRVFIPKIIGPNSKDMVMVEIRSIEEIESFPKSKWGIPEPELSHDFKDPTLSGIIDVICVPGCAFDTYFGRLGHGKGYYDCFIERTFKINFDFGLPPPKTIGLSLQMQLLEDQELPMEPHDRKLDAVISPKKIVGFI